ncbi:hypothetical protein N8Z70_04015, partial [Candidatus Puniceispirillum sp.]|nr:hypothetical protein [Candidatus Puniceispirillum sp.]
MGIKNPEFWSSEDFSFANTEGLDPLEAFAGGSPGVSLISESDILARKTELGIAESDWEYLSSLFNSDAGYYNGLFFKWGDDLGTAPSLTYSFVDGGTFSLDSAYMNDANETGMEQVANDFVSFANSDPSRHMVEFSLSEKEFISDSLNAFSNISGIQFTEVDDNNSTSYGDIRFHLQDFSAWQQHDPAYSFGGFAYGPWGDAASNEWTLGGDVFLDSKHEPYDGFFETTVTHEIGHALGLSHPFDGYGVIGDDSDSLDNPYTVMTYDRDPAFLGVDPMLADIMAMEFIYGGTDQANIGDTTHWLDPGLLDVWSNDYTNNNGISYGLNARMSIVDDLGVDTINANDISNGIFLNLAPGSWSNLSGTNPYLLAPGDDAEGEQIASSFDSNGTHTIATDADILDFGQLYIESKTYIEKCNLTDYGDIIFDNDADNVIYCEGGDDLVSLSLGNDQVFGGGGNDQVSIFGSPEDFVIDQKAAGYELRNINFDSINFAQEIYLEGVETISFYGHHDGILFTSSIESFEGASESELPFTFKEVRDTDGAFTMNDMAYRAKVMEYSGSGFPTRDVCFTDLNGSKHTVATSNDYGSNVSFTGVQSETMGNGKYAIVFAARDDHAGTTAPEYFYRIFDAEKGAFDGAAVLMGSGQNHSGPGITHLEMQETGRVFMYNDQYTYAEIRVDKNSVEHSFGVALGFNGAFDANRDFPYSAGKVDVDPGVSEVVFKRLDSLDYQTVASASDFGGGRISFNNVVSETMGNGKYLIVFTAVDEDNGPSFPEYYYRVFDSNTGQFSNSVTSLGLSDAPSGGVVDLELQESGRVLMRSDTNHFAEINDNGSGFDHVFGNANSWLDANMMPRNVTPYKASISPPDQDGHQNVLFTDLNGDSWIVANHEDYGSQPEFNSFASGCVGDGKYVIVFTSRDQSNGGNAHEYYYRIFDTNTSSFEAPASYMGSSDLGAAGTIEIDYQEDGRVVMYTDQRIYAEIRVEGVGGLSVEFAELGENSDKYYGSEQADYVKTGGGADYILAGAGDDIIIVEGTVLKTDKNPYLTTANYVLVDTGAGDDIVEISTGWLDYSTFSGEVKLVSGGGDDTLVVYGDPGLFSWSAGTGVNKNDIILTSTDASIVLANQMAYEENHVFSYIEFFYYDAASGETKSDLFQVNPNAPSVDGAIITILGTDLADNIDYDGFGPASIAGLKGDDIINGDRSDDKLDGGEGDDLLFGNGGEDTLSGGLGEDFLDGGHGSDKLYGGYGDDVYKIDLDYSGFLDRVGYDDVVYNDDGTINWDLTDVSPWDDVIGNVDSIVDDGGTDRIWITDFQPTLNPFDQYKEMLSIADDGTLVMKWGWDADSPSSYQYTLKEGFEFERFDPTVIAANQYGGYVVTKNNVNSTTEPVKCTWPVFAEEWQAEEYYRKEHGLNWDAPATVHKIQIAPRTITHDDGTGYALESATLVPWQEFWVPGPEGSVIEQTATNILGFNELPANSVNVADTLFYDSIDKQYYQTGNLDRLQDDGKNLDFDLGRIDTWPGFRDLPAAIDPANPEAGTQEYYLKNFKLGDSTTYPTAGEMPFVNVITGYDHPGGYYREGHLVSMESLSGLPYDQSLNVHKVSDNTGSSDLIWRDGNIEFVITTKNIAPYVAGHANGFAAAYDSFGNIVVAYAVQEAGQWNLEIKTFNPQTGAELSSVITSDQMQAPIYGGDQVMVNIAALGNNTFGVNLAKFDEYDEFSQLKFYPVEVAQTGSIMVQGVWKKDTDGGYPDIFKYNGDDVDLSQGFKVTDFAVKDEHGNWVNTIESIVFTSPAEEYELGQKYVPNILNGAVSVYDSVTQALTSNMGTEYFLSPSGVVDFGTERTPATFNTDGSVKTYREVTKWKGADTDKSFFLVANTDMAGRNDLGLGFDGSTDSFTDKSDVNQFTPLQLL